MTAATPAQRTIAANALGTQAYIAEGDARRARQQKRENDAAAAEARAAAFRAVAQDLTARPRPERTR